jgi:hypothetical protein
MNQYIIWILISLFCLYPFASPRASAKSSLDNSFTKCDMTTNYCINIHNENRPPWDCGSDTCNSVVASISQDGGTTWQPAHSVAQPSKYASYLTQLACSNDLTRCTVVGSVIYTDSVETFPIALFTANKGVDWLVSDIPNKDDYPAHDGLSLVSCSDNGINCTSLGYYTPSHQDKTLPLGYYSSDGGQHWNFSLTLLPQSDQNNLTTLNCDNTLSVCNTFGTSSVYGGFIRYQSLDKGMNWNYQSMPNRSGLVACDNDNGSLCINVDVTNDRTILSYTSTDAGMSWMSSPTPPLPPSTSTKIHLNAIACDGKMKSCAAVGSYESSGSDGIITHTLGYITTDSGQTWKTSTSPNVESIFYNSLEAISCDAGENRCVAMGYRGGETSSDIIPLSYVSSDFGLTWTYSSTPPPPKNSVPFSDYFDFIDSVTCNWGNHSCTASGEYFSTSDGKWLSLNYVSSNNGVTWT